MRQVGRCETATEGLDKQAVRKRRERERERETQLSKTNRLDPT